MNYEENDLLRTLDLRETGFLSSSSEDLIEFINNNLMFKASTFLYNMDNNSFNKSTYNDTMNQARGLADILKNKYFNVPILSEIYFVSPIIETKLKLPNGEIKRLEITKNLRKGKTIYAVLNRLGFNDKELYYILSKYYYKMISKTLLDVFKMIVEEEQYKINSDNKDDKVFYNKVNYYVNYFERKIKNDSRCEIDKQIDLMFESINELLKARDDIDKKIAEIRKDILKLEQSKEGIKK